MSDVPGLASVHINGLIHGIVREDSAQSNLGPTTLYTTFCKIHFPETAAVVQTIRRGEQKEEATCIPCILAPWDP